MMNNFSDSKIENAALTWLGEIGFAISSEPETAHFVRKFPWGAG
jgi:hypothetical protein